MADSEKEMFIARLDTCGEGVDDGGGGYIKSLHDTKPFYKII